MRDETKSSKPITNEELVVKYKTTGKSNKFISDKLGISEVMVEQMWQSIQKAVASSNLNGYEYLKAQYTVLCHQYNLMGESLKMLAEVLSGGMSSQEIRELITDDKEETLHNFITKCMVFRPFIPAGPIEFLGEKERNN